MAWPRNYFDPDPYYSSRSRYSRSRSQYQIGCKRLIRNLATGYITIKEAWADHPVYSAYQTIQDYTEFLYDLGLVVEYEGKYSLSQRGFQAFRHFLIDINNDSSNDSNLEISEYISRNILPPLNQRFDYIELKLAELSGDIIPLNDPDFGWFE